MSLEYALYLSEVQKQRVFSQFPQYQKNKRFILACIKDFDPTKAEETFREDEEIMFEYMKLRNYNSHFYTTKDSTKLKQFYLRLLDENLGIFHLFPEELRNDKEVTLAAIRMNVYRKGLNIMHASPLIQSDDEIMMEAFTLHLENYEYDPFFNSFISRKWKENESLVLGIPLIAKHYSNLPEEIKNDKRIALQFVKQYDYFNYFTKLSPKLRLDVDILSEVLKRSYSFNWKEIPMEMLKNEQVLLSGMNHCADYLSDKIPKELQNKEFYMKCLDVNPYFLKYLDDEFNDNQEIVQKVISKSGYCIQYASERLKNDYKTVMMTVSQYGQSIIFASDELKNNEEFAKEILKINGMCLAHLSSAIQDKKELVMIAIENNDKSLEFASEELKKDPEIIMRAIEKDPNSLRLASKQFSDRKVILEAVHRRGDNLQYLSASFRSDFEIISLGIKKSRTAAQYLQKKLKKNKEIVLKLIKFSRMNHKYVDEILKNDRDVLYECVKYSWNLPEIIPPGDDDEIMMEWLKRDASQLKLTKMRKDRKIILELVRLNKNIWKYLDEENLVVDKEIQWLSIGNYKRIREIEPNIYFSFV
jgi:hypothetical protein